MFAVVCAHSTVKHQIEVARSRVCFTHSDVNYRITYVNTNTTSFLNDVTNKVTQHQLFSLPLDRCGVTVTSWSLSSRLVEGMGPKTGTMRHAVLAIPCAASTSPSPPPGNPPSPIPPPPLPLPWPMPPEPPLSEPYWSLKDARARSLRHT